MSSPTPAPEQEPLTTTPPNPVSVQKPASFTKGAMLGTIRDSFAVLLDQDATWDRYRP